MPRQGTEITKNDLIAIRSLIIEKINNEDHNLSKENLEFLKVLLVAFDKVIKFVDL